MRREVINATVWSVLFTAIVGLLIIFGSRNLSHFDAPLVGYTFATLFATFGIVYRYSMWLQRPPTAVYWKRGWQVFFSPKYFLANLIQWFKRLFAEIGLNTFILRRSSSRGLAHFLLMWGVVLAALIENNWLDHDFIEKNTVGFDQVDEHVKDWTPQRTAEITGIKEKAIRQAAELWGRANSSFLLHARGMEHHTHGVQNVLGAINIVLASGRIGREGCGYGTITGQGNGQGGREHGQKCDQLPGARDISNRDPSTLVVFCHDGCIFARRSNDSTSCCACKHRLPFFKCRIAVVSLCA